MSTSVRTMPRQASMKVLSLLLRNGRTCPDTTPSTGASMKVLSLLLRNKHTPFFHMRSYHGLNESPELIAQESNPCPATTRPSGCLNESPELIAQEYRTLPRRMYQLGCLNESPELIAQEFMLPKTHAVLSTASMKVLSLLLRNNA